MTRACILATTLALVATATRAADAPKGTDAPTEAQAKAEAKPAPTYAGEETCSTCHDEQATAIAASPHRVL